MEQNKKSRKPRTSSKNADKKPTATEEKKEKKELRKKPRAPIGLLRSLDRSTDKKFAAKVDFYRRQVEIV